MLPREDNPVDFEKVLQTISSFFDRGRWRFAAIGAFGLHAYGLSRVTQDLDFVTEAAAQSELVAYLESIGYETLHRSAGYSNHLHPDPAFGRVDFVFVTGETARKLFETTGATLHAGGISVPVPKPEHLAAMKVHAIKNDPSRTFRELADIQFILGLPGIDAQEIRRYFHESGLIDLYDEIRKRL